jgi:hypothetical protein
MRRRDFMALFGSIPAVWSSKLLAQQSQGISRVALLMALSDSDPEGAACVRAFRRGLQELRWEEGINLQIDVRWASRSTQKE